MYVNSKALSPSAMFDTGTIHLANDDLLACLIGRGGRVVHHGVADELGDAVGE